jgi:hypothetical protein
MVIDELTRSTLFNIPCSNSKDGEYFSHHVHNHVGHGSTWSLFRVSLKTCKKILDANEDIYEHILARFYIFGCLTIYASVMTASIERSRMMLTKRRMPMPEKIALAGENT